MNQIGLFEVVSKEDKYKEWIIQDFSKRRPLNYGAVKAVVEKYQGKVDFSVMDYLKEVIFGNPHLLRKMKSGSVLMLYFSTDSSPVWLLKQEHDYPSYLHDVIDYYFKKDLGGCYIALHNDNEEFVANIRGVFAKMNKESPV